LGNPENLDRLNPAQRAAASLPDQAVAHPPVPQFDALTGLRAIAALGVLFCHFSEIDTDHNLYFNWGILNPLLIHGAIGVDVFFVLSGFILTYVYRSKFSLAVSGANYIGFMRYRFARLYPVHVITMLVMAGIFVVGRRLGTLPHHSYAFTPLSILANFAMLHAWFPGRVASMNGPAWSISAEWFAYLLFPLVYCLLMKTGRAWPWIVIAISVTVSFNSQNLSPLPMIALEFPVGMAALEIYSRYKIDMGRWASLIPLAMVLLSVYVLGATDPVQAQQTYAGAHLRTGVIVSAALLLICLTNGKDLIGRLLSHRAVVYAGEISYSVYMCHWAVWTILHKGLAHFPRFQHAPQPEIMLAATVITIACSILCYHFVEMPGRILLRNLGARKSERIKLAAIPVELPRA
jgi:peptidoglycan/LPS O-acetylase OafA/YrhL